MADDDQTTEIYDGFDGYQEDTLDPGPWMLIFTTVFCFGVMLVVVPLMVKWKIHSRKKKYLTEDPLIMETSNEDGTEVTAKSILSFDKEMKKILSLAIPFTISGLSTEICSSTCLALVGNYVGTHAVAAYALVSMLVGLTDGVLQGPIFACTTLCAHAVGAGNSTLAGHYIQLAIFFYLFLNVPVLFFWFVYMRDIVLFLEWGEEETAQMAEDYIRVYFLSYLLGGIMGGLWQLLEVADHVVAGTVVSIAWGVVNVAVIGWLVTSGERTLQDIGKAYNAIALFFVLGTVVWAEFRGWLKPFRQGLYQTFALKNGKAVKLMVKQAVPLSFGSLLFDAQWVILTFFASYLGPAEVAAWAILGSIWDIFYSTTSGIGDAAEIRVSLHFGENHPSMARLAGYKTLFLSMSMATVISIVYLSLQYRLPTWFTKDETLQSMLIELVPFAGVANLTMQFGMTCESLIGAQGKYKLATWVSFISNWGVAMPMAAILVFIIRMDLQGLTAAVVTGYVSTGATLSYVLLSTNWKKIAQKIQERNAEAIAGEAGENCREEYTEEDLYASLHTTSHASKAAARRNIHMLTIPAGQQSGLVIGNMYDRPDTYVFTVRNYSPLFKPSQWEVKNPYTVERMQVVSSGQDVARIPSMEEVEEAPKKMTKKRKANDGDKKPVGRKGEASEEWSVFGFSGDEHNELAEASYADWRKPPAKKRRTAAKKKGPVAARMTSRKRRGAGRGRR